VNPIDYLEYYEGIKVGITGKINNGKPTPKTGALPLGDAPMKHLI